MGVRFEVECYIILYYIVSSKFLLNLVRENASSAKIFHQRLTNAGFFLELLIAIKQVKFYHENVLNAFYVISKLINYIFFRLAQEQLRVEKTPQVIFPKKKKRPWRPKNQRRTTAESCADHPSETSHDNRTRKFEKYVVQSIARSTRMYRFDFLCIIVFYQSYNQRRSEINIRIFTAQH